MAKNRIPDGSLDIRPGVSLLNTRVAQMLKNTTTLRACAVKVANHTHWTLESAGIYVKGGRVVTPQCSVEPGTAEAFVAEKTRGTATGSYGTASFEVKGLAEYITIMWSVPFNGNIYSNWLGIEVTSSHHGSDDFDRMYYGPTKETSVIRDFKRNLVPMTLKTKELEIRGTMGSSPQTEAHIDVYQVERA